MSGEEIPYQPIDNPFLEKELRYIRNFFQKIDLALQNLELTGWKKDNPKYHEHYGLTNKPWRFNNNQNGITETIYFDFGYSYRPTKECLMKAGLLFTIPFANTMDFTYRVNPEDETLVLLPKKSYLKTSDCFVYIREFEDVMDHEPRDFESILNRKREGMVKPNIIRETPEGFHLFGPVLNGSVSEQISAAHPLFIPRIITFDDLIERMKKPNTYSIFGENSLSILQKQYFFIRTNRSLD